MIAKIATSHISVLRVRLPMLKKQKGLAIPLLFSYARRTHKTNLNAVQLQILGL